MNVLQVEQQLVSNAALAKQASCAQYGHSHRRVTASFPICQLFLQMKHDSAAMLWSTFFRYTTNIIVQCDNAVAISFTQCTEVQDKRLHLDKELE